MYPFIILLSSCSKLLLVKSVVKMESFCRKCHGVTTQLKIVLRIMMKTKLE